MGQRLAVDCLRTYSPMLQLRLLGRRDRLRFSLGCAAEQQFKRVCHYSPLWSPTLYVNSLHDV